MKRVLMLALVAAGAIGNAPGAKVAPVVVEGENVGFKVEMNHTNALYRVGEETVLTITATNGAGKQVQGGKLRVSADNFGEKKLLAQEVDLAQGNPFMVRATLDEPGFIKFAITSVDGGSHAEARRHGAEEKPFIWGVGYEPEKIKAGGKRPADFERFWSDAIAKLDQTEPDFEPRMTLQPEKSKGKFDYWRINFATYGGKRVYGFLSVPKDRSKGPFPTWVEVCSAGTGKWSIGMHGSEDKVIMYFTPYFFEPPETVEGSKAAQAKMGEELLKKYGERYYGGAGLAVSREDFHFYGSLLGINRAVNWLWKQGYVDQSRFHYAGGSQGGAFGWMLCGINHKFTSAVFRVPALSDQLAGNVGRSPAWPQMVKHCPKGMEEAQKANAAYFDGASFAPGITCPVRVTCGFTDCTCPPPAVYATYNLLGSKDKYIYNCIGKGHGGQTWQYDRLAAIWQESLGAVKPVGAVRTVGAVDQLKVGLDERGRIVSMMVDGTELVKPLREGEHRTSFDLKCTRTDSFTNSVNVYAWDARCERVEMPKGVEYVYSHFSKEPVKEVRMTVRFDGEGVRWGIRVKMAEGWALEDTDYPKIPLLTRIGESGADDRFVCGSCKGGVVYDPGSKTNFYVSLKQPGPLTAQFEALYDGKRGVYLAAEDSEGEVKSLRAMRYGGAINASVVRHGFFEGEVIQPFEVVTKGLVAKDEPLTWHDAADVYREWAERQKWCKTRFLERGDVPGWLKDAPIMTRLGGDWMRKPEAVERLVKEGFGGEFPRVPLIAVMWGWEKHGGWVSPDYFPVVCGNERFAEMVARLRESGAHAYPWPSGYHWTLTYDKQTNGTWKLDQREDFRKVAGKHSIMMRDGTLYERTPDWLKGGALGQICGGDRWTRDFWSNGICAPLAKMGCDMIQIDQVCGGGFRPCWNRAHGHIPNEGRWKTEAICEQFASMREAMGQYVKEPVYSVEEPNEMLNHLVHLQDYRDMETKWDEVASVFNYIYHEYLPCFQSNANRKLEWMAHQAADGQIPFFILPGAANADKAFSWKREYTDYMVRWVKLYRGEGRKFLAYGRQVKPPEASGFGKGEVFVNSYEAADGSKATVLANATRKELEVMLRRGGRRKLVRLSPAEVRLTDD